jgi:hemolysin III
MSSKNTPNKPLLRGFIHQCAFFFSMGACTLLIAKSSSDLTLIASIIYSFGLLLMLGVSATYHRIHWEPKQRLLLKRLDHSAIFILIAATATPLSLLSLPDESGRQFLTIMWAAAGAGILQSLFWAKAPKFVTAIFYVGMGWLTLPYLPELKNSLGSTLVSFILGGGVVYTLGAVFYALKRPNFFPRTFGYHELFHTFTVVGAALHFMVIYKLIN